MLIELLRKRRSIRQFEDKPVSPEQCDISDRSRTSVSKFQGL